MGKGSRNKNREEKKEMGATAKKSFPVFTVFCIVVGLLLALSIVHNIYVSNGGSARNQVVMEVDGEKISALDYQYVYMNLVNNYWYWMQMSGVQSLSDLKTKPSMLDADKTWAEYLGEQAFSSLKNELFLYADAKKQNLTLSEENRTWIDQQFASLEAEAKKNAYTLDEFLSAMFVPGFKRADMERMLTISCLAQQNATAVQDGLTYTDEKLEAYYSEHRAEMNTYTFNVQSFPFTTEVGSDAAEKDSKEAAETKAKALEEKIRGGTPFAEAAEDTTDSTKRENLVYSYISGGEKVREWLGDAARKENDLAVLEGDSAYYVVQFVRAERDEYSMVDLKRVTETIETDSSTTDEEKKTKMETLKKKLEDKLNAWDKTSEGFTTMAKEINENLTNDGLVEDATKNVYSDEMEAWLFDTARKAGDYTLLENASKTGYEVLYFVGYGEKYWKQYATNQMKSEDFDAYLEKLEEELKNVTVANESEALALVK